jgi:esterase/lipase superfamily enzyme
MPLKAPRAKIVKLKWQISLMLSLLASYSFAQKAEAIYSEEIKTGTNIYVITNRPSEDKIGYLSFPNEIKPDRNLTFIEATYFQTDSIHSEITDSSLFVSEIIDQHKDCLLFIHGDSKTYEQAVMRGFDMKHLHDVNVIVFSWPSKEPDINGVKNFKNSKLNVTASFDHFIQLMHFMEKLSMTEPFSSGEANLSMFIHSLGNAYLEKLGTSEVIKMPSSVIFDNIILNAAAVNQKDHSQWVEKLKIQNNIYITSNKQDFNLKGVRIFTKDGKQLGEKVEHPLAKNAVYVNFSVAVGLRFPTGTTHTYFIGDVTDKSKSIRSFYRKLLHGSVPELSFENNLFKRDDGLGYDILK